MTCSTGTRRKRPGTAGTQDAAGVSWPCSSCKASQQRRGWRCPFGHRTCPGRPASARLSASTGAMGQKPKMRFNPTTKIGSKMGGAPKTPKWASCPPRLSFGWMSEAPKLGNQKNGPVFNFGSLFKAAWKEYFEVQETHTCTFDVPSANQRLGRPGARESTGTP